MAVGIVNNRRVERCEIDLSGMLVSMPQRFADDRKRDVAEFCCAAPRVATDVGGEPKGDSCEISYFF